VTVEVTVGDVVAKTLDYIWTEGNGRDKVAIHDVEVEVFGSSGEGFFGFRCEGGHVAVQDGGANLGGAAMVWHFWMVEAEE